MTQFAYFTQGASYSKYGSASINDYVLGEKLHIENVVAKLGIPIGTAIAGAMAEENNDYHKSSIDTSKNYLSDQYALSGLGPAAAAQFAQDFAQRGEAYALLHLGYSAFVGTRTNDEWVALYNTYKNNPPPAVPSRWDKFANPILMDVGQANFKIATAIDLLNDPNRQADVTALAKQLRIYSINWGGFWYPAPYSERTARLTGEFIGHTMNQRSHARTLEQLLEYWKTNMPELFEGVAPVTFYPQVDQLTGVIFFTMGSAKRPDTKFTLRYGGLQKGYRHYPQVPQVKDGHILIPGYDLNNKPIVQAGDRVLDSLDDYPPDWKRGECVLKRIDLYWFIQMCRAA